MLLKAFVIHDLLKVHKDELLLRAICAVISIYGILALEYKTVHSDSGKTLFEVYLELIKSL